MYTKLLALYIVNVRIVLIILGAFSMLIQSPVGDSFTHRDGVLWGNIIKPTSEFHHDPMETVFRQILSKTEADSNLVHVEVMDRADSYVLTAMWRDELNYESWRSMFSDYEKGVPPMAELLAIGKNAAMRIRDDRGNVSKTILHGDDPYIVHACGKDLTLIHLGINEPLHEPDYKNTYVSVHFFMIAVTQPNEDLARCALNEIRRLSKVPDVFVSIRRDPWFIEDSLFPVVSPFLSEFHPPSKEGFESSLQWTCSFSDDAKTICWNRGMKK